MLPKINADRGIILSIYRDYTRPQRLCSQPPLGHTGCLSAEPLDPVPWIAVWVLGLFVRSSANFNPHRNVKAIGHGHRNQPTRRLQVNDQTVCNALPAERRAWFLRYADSLSTGDISRLFPDREFSEAAGVLQMVSQNPDQLPAYNARLKFQRDEAARMLQAKLEGRQEGFEEGLEKGLQKGRHEGRINLLRELLGLPTWPEDEFSTRDATQLSNIADQLQQQLRARGD
jgi:hypothetical protein